MKKKGKKKIVSANYHDRSSPKRWLVRDMGAEPSTATEYKSVRMTGVVFCPSSDYETGFGCNVVAHCETATGDSKAKPRGVELTFKIDAFYTKEGSQKVGKCKTLLLTTDGKMFAIL